jgi:Domain of unknown function (DUF397)
MAALDLSDAVWRKSRHSSINGCVEVAVIGDAVAVRDSKDPSGSVLVFQPHEWSAFVSGVKDGEFDFTS